MLRAECQRGLGFFFQVTIAQTLRPSSYIFNHGRLDSGPGVRAMGPVGFAMLGGECHRYPI